MTAVRSDPRLPGIAGGSVPPSAVGALVLASAVVTLAPQPTLAAAVLGAGVALAVAHRWLLSWPVLVSSIALMAILVPARRYALPIDLPYKLEPYRLVMLATVGLLIVSLLVDPATRLRRLGFGWAAAALVGTSVLSLLANVSAVQDAGADQRVIGNLAALVTVLLPFVLVQLVGTRRLVHGVLGCLVGGGALVGLAALIERRSGWNAIRLFDSVFPVSVDDQPLEQIGGAIRFGRARAFGSAQHPLALGAELMLLIPPALYLARHAGWPRTERTRHLVWVGCALLAVAGVASSVTRLTVIALAATAFVGWRVRGDVVKRAALVAVPVIGLLSLVSAGAINDLIEAFQPEQGLFAEQSVDKSDRSSGRLADLPRVVRELRDHGPLGLGYAVQDVTAEEANILILDNAYAGRLLETGVPGFVALLAFIFVPLGRLLRLARRPAVAGTAGADLAAALACTTVAWAVSLFFYDGFAFAQPVLTMTFLLGIAGWLAVEVEEGRPVTSPWSRARHS